jgi:CheY-like chemotaxis protein
MRHALKDKVFLIALTGYAQPQDRQRAFTAGFDVHLTKPADLDELARLVTLSA